ncbi:MAG TPA: type II secretion system F family protein [Kineosporiaceae bacterium]|nr:type II secretion system F family protein [Kineosporiaceae bacterium]
MNNTLELSEITRNLTGLFGEMLGLGAVIGASLALLVYSLVRREDAPVDARSRSARFARQLRELGTRLPIGVLVGLLTLLITRWPVAGVAATTLVLAWPALMGGARGERRAAERLEALAIWTESMRDTTAGSVGLEQAIIATSRTAPAPIAVELATLADRLRVRVPLPQALHRLADDLDDASADLVVAALLLNSRLRGPGLRQVLGSLSDSARAELEMRGRVMAGRAATRRSVQIVVGFTGFFVLGLVLFNPSYVEPYDHPTGQLVLLFVVCFFGAGFFWLKRLSAYDVPERFLHTGRRIEADANAAPGALR